MPYSWYFVGAQQGARYRIGARGCGRGWDGGDGWSIVTRWSGVVSTANGRAVAKAKAYGVRAVVVGPIRSVMGVLFLLAVEG